MIIEHRLLVTGICPVDLKHDVYDCMVRVRRMLPVEEILAAVKDATQKPAYQDDITLALHRTLACEVTTVGEHSGVKTTVKCGEGA
jgi:heterodisulfide reductase subunit C